MRQTICSLATLGICLILSMQRPASGQSFNIVLAPPGQTPPSTYAAAGLPGPWTAIEWAWNVNTFNLVDVNGVTTVARIYQYGGTELRSDDDAATGGDDDLLMDDCLITYTPSLESCFFFRDLQLGTYEVLVYAWMPNRPDVMAYTSSDEEPDYPHKTVGGAWPGQHEEGITFTRHICYVTHPVLKMLRIHSGIVPGANAADGAACNALQIRKLPARAPGDMNCDGKVNGADILGFVAALDSPGAYSALHPVCNVTNADMNGDRYQDGIDLPMFVTALLTATP